MDFLAPQSYKMTTTLSCEDGSAPSCAGGGSVTCMNASLRTPLDFSAPDSRACHALKLLRGDTTTRPS